MTVESDDASDISSSWWT